MNAFLRPPGARAGFARALAYATFEALAASAPIVVVYIALRQVLAGTLTHELVALVAAALVIALALRAVAGTLAAGAMRDAAVQATSALRTQIAERLRSSRLDALALLDAGETMSRVTHDLSRVEEVLPPALDALWVGTLVSACTGAVLFAIDRRLAVAALVSLPLAIPVFAISGRFAAIAAPRVMLNRELATSALFEFMESLPLLRAYNVAANRFARLKLSFMGMQARALEVAVAPAVPGFLALFVVECGFVAALLFGAYLGSTRGLDPATFVLFLAVAVRFHQASIEVLDAWLRTKELASAFRRATALLELPQLERGSAATPRAADSPLDIELRDVSFTYAGASEPALRQVNLRLREGSVVAVVGPSGAGKTTLACLLTRLWDPTEGSVRLGEVDLRAYAADALAQRVSAVFQDTHLFRSSVLDNIVLARPEASLEQVRAAARMAQCDEFVAALPQGYLTQVGEGGVTLSLGERQRVAIARAILAEAPVLVLDESTASLDASTELAIHRALAALVARGTTIVIVTHRLRTVRRAHRILVMDRGRLAEEGTHEALLAAGGVYAHMWTAHEEARHWRLASMPPA